jgi:hypothetical protein
MSKEAAVDPLIDHVVVLDRVRPHLFRVSSEVDPDTGEHLEEAEETTAALDYVGEGRFQEVPHSCSCGHELTADAEKLLPTWARHVAKETGLAAKLLLDHPVIAIRGQRVEVLCGCGAAFEASGADPTDPGGALHGWADHVEALA